MAVPTAPAAGEPIAEAWGDVVHDSIVAMDIQVGTANVAVAGAVSGVTTVTFPRPFASAPVVVASMQSTSVAYVPFVNGPPTATTVSVGFSHKTAGTSFTDTRQVTWIAYGPRA
jgi:hypothetical protein